MSIGFLKKFLSFFCNLFARARKRRSKLLLRRPHKREEKRERRKRELLVTPAGLEPASQGWKPCNFAFRPWRHFTFCGEKNYSEWLFIPIPRALPRGLSYWVSFFSSHLVLVLYHTFCGLSSTFFCYFLGIWGPRGYNPDLLLRVAVIVSRLFVLAREFCSPCCATLLTLWSKSGVLGLGTFPAISFCFLSAQGGAV